MQSSSSCTFFDRRQRSQRRRQTKGAASQAATTRVSCRLHAARKPPRRPHAPERGSRQPLSACTWLGSMRPILASHAHFFAQTGDPQTCPRGFVRAVQAFNDTNRKRLSVDIRLQKLTTQAAEMTMRCHFDKPKLQTRSSWKPRRGVSSNRQFSQRSVKKGAPSLSEPEVVPVHSCLRPNRDEVQVSSFSLAHDGCVVFLWGRC